MAQEVVLVASAAGGHVVQAVMPRFGASDEMDDPHLGPELLQSWQVGVEGLEDAVVDEGQVARNVPCGPVGEIAVEEALIGAIEAAMFFCEVHELGVRVLGRAEDEDARVEAVGPPRVRRSRQLFPLKQIVDVSQHLEKVSV